MVFHNACLAGHKALCTASVLRRLEGSSLWKCYDQFEVGYRYDTDDLHEGTPSCVNEYNTKSFVKDECGGADKLTATYMKGTAINRVSTWQGGGPLDDRQCEGSTPVQIADELQRELDEFCQAEYLAICDQGQTRNRQFNPMIIWMNDRELSCNGEAVARAYNELDLEQDGRTPTNLPEYASWGNGMKWYCLIHKPGELNRYSRWGICVDNCGQYKECFGNINWYRENRWYGRILQRDGEITTRIRTYLSITPNECHVPQPCNSCAGGGLCTDGLCIPDLTNCSHKCICYPPLVVDPSGRHCVIEECRDVDCGQHGYCTVPPGSSQARCQCYPGYVVPIDGTQCQIDECHPTNVCQGGICRMLEGGYDCQCPAGYVYEPPTCVPQRTCSSNPNCGPNTRCTDVASGHVCECLTYYEGNPYDMSVGCTPINYCAEERDICKPDSTCHQTAGQNGVPLLDCICNPGFEDRLNDPYLPYVVPRTCTPIHTPDVDCWDRCAANYCGPNWTCTCEIWNPFMPGGDRLPWFWPQYQPKCECRGDYLMEDNGLCIPVDGCSDPDLHYCQEYERMCDSGWGQPPTCNCEPPFYAGDGYNCGQVDLCLIDNGGCGPWAICTGGLGQLPTCQCRPGFLLPSGACGPSSGCPSPPSGVHPCYDQGYCEYEQQTDTYTCHCPPGYYGTGIGQAGCQPIDYCSMNLGDFLPPPNLGHLAPNPIDEYDQDWTICRVGEICENLHGVSPPQTGWQYRCVCDTQNGYVLNPTSGECEWINRCDDGSFVCDDTTALCRHYPGHEPYCQCPAHYLYTPNFRGCTPIDTCTPDNGGCPREQFGWECSTPAPGHPSLCQCIAPFYRVEQDYYCVPVDLCEHSPADYNSPYVCSGDNMECYQDNEITLPGCRCIANHEPDPNGPGCIPIDPCRADLNPCDTQTEICYGHPGYPAHCMCLPNLRRNPVTGRCDLPYDPTTPPSPLQGDLDNYCTRVMTIRYQFKQCMGLPVPPLPGSPVWVARRWVHHGYLEDGSFPYVCVEESTLDKVNGPYCVDDCGDVANCDGAPSGHSNFGIVPALELKGWAETRKPSECQCDIGESPPQLPVTSASVQHDLDAFCTIYLKNRCLEDIQQSGSGTPEDCDIEYAARLPTQCGGQGCTAGNLKCYAVSEMVPGTGDRCMTDCLAPTACTMVPSQTQAPVVPPQPSRIQDYANILNEIKCIAPALAPPPTPGQPAPPQSIQSRLDQECRQWGLAHCAATHQNPSTCNGQTYVARLERSFANGAYNVAFHCYQETTLDTTINGDCVDNCLRALGCRGGPTSGSQLIPVPANTQLDTIAIAHMTTHNLCSIEESPLQAEMNQLCRSIADQECAAPSYVERYGECTEPVVFRAQHSAPPNVSSITPDTPVTFSDVSTVGFYCFAEHQLLQFGHDPQCVDVCGQPSYCSRSFPSQAVPLFEIGDLSKHQLFLQWARAACGYTPMAAPPANTPSKLQAALNQACQDMWTSGCGTGDPICQIEWRMRVRTRDGAQALECVMIHGAPHTESMECIDNCGAPATCSITPSSAAGTFADTNYLEPYMRLLLPFYCDYGNSALQLGDPTHVGIERVNGLPQDYIQAQLDLYCSHHATRMCQGQAHCPTKFLFRSKSDIFEVIRDNTTPQWACYGADHATDVLAFRCANLSGHLSRCTPMPAPDSLVMNVSQQELKTTLTNMVQQHAHGTTPSSLQLGMKPHPGAAKTPRRPPRGPLPRKAAQRLASR